MPDDSLNRGVLMSQVVDSWMLGRARVHRIEEWCGPFLTPHLLFAGFDADAYAACKAAVPVLPSASSISSVPSVTGTTT